jgi:probable phosphoglycerate mutase
LIVIRHGETEWNAEGRIQGHQDVLLNERGQSQADALARRLKGESVDAIYCSDLRRAMQTAEPIAEAVKSSIAADHRLREWKLGVLEGLVPTEAKVQEPEAYRIYFERDPEVEVPGGESIRCRLERATVCVQEIANEWPNGRVIVVTHGGILDDLYRFAKGIDLDTERDWKLYNCGINTLRIEDGRWSIERWGDIEHLRKIGSMADWDPSIR